tara:strand:- start:288 stop:527 length:240 start_codon:yes stop_codon:yes gene_type:complete
MWKTVLGYALSNTNYGVANLPNMYNFILSLMDDLSEEQNQRLIDSLILHLGKSFYKDLRTYLIDKVPNSKHLALINRIV